MSRPTCRKSGVSSISSFNINSGLENEKTSDRCLHMFIFKMTVIERISEKN